MGQWTREGRPTPGGPRPGAGGGRRGAGAPGHGAILAEAGYLVASAGHGREAASLLATPAGQVDLVVSDVVMPVVGGGELRQVLARTHPTLPVIWISRYPRDAVMYGDALGDGQVSLQKPVSMEALLSAAARLTGRDGARGSG